MNAPDDSTELCFDCGVENPVWFSPNELWNKVMAKDKPLIVCPICFIKRAEAAGVTPTGWLLDVERLVDEATQQDEHQASEQASSDAWLNKLIEACTVIERDDNENNDKVIDVKKLKSEVQAHLQEREAAAQLKATIETLDDIIVSLMEAEYSEAHLLHACKQQRKEAERLLLAVGEGKNA